MRAFLYLSGLLLALQPLESKIYTLQDLGTLATEESIVYSLNNQNRVTGTLRDYQQNKIDFIWDPTKGLSFFTKATSYQAPLLNNHNQLVGIYWQSAPSWFSGKIFTKHLHVFSGEGAFQDLGAPDAWEIQILADEKKLSIEDNKEFSIADFNDEGTVLIANAANPRKATRFALWQNGTFEYLPSHPFTCLYAVNNKGVILARKMVKKDGREIPFLVLYDRQKDLTYEVIEDINLLRRQLNDKGQVVVVHWQKDQGIFKGYLWDPLKGLMLLKNFFPISINNHSQMVGMQISPQKKLVPAFWDKGEVISLNEALGIGPASAWSELKEVKKINDSGYILGLGLYKGKKHGFVLIPKDGGP